MNDRTKHYPYCNSVIPANAVDCPRCGDRASTPRREPRGRPYAGGFALIFLAVLIAGGIWWAKRGGSPQQLRHEGEGIDRPAPAELSALGYLPDECNVVVGLHLRALLAEPRGAELLRSLNLSSEPGQPSLLERLTGLTVEQIDHAALGLPLENGGVRWVLAVHTREPFDQKALRERLKAGRAKPNLDRQVYPVKIPNVRLFSEGDLWFASDRTLVFNVNADWGKVPSQPRAEVNRFNGRLAELIGQKLPRDSVAWVAAHADDWSRTALPLLGALAPIDADTKAAWGDLRSLALSVRFAEEPRGFVFARFDDAAKAERLRKFLTDGSVKRQMEVVEAKQTEGEAMVEVRIDAERLKEIAQGVLPKR